MALKDEIEKPIIKLVYVETDSETPSHVLFDVEVNFKPVNGVVPYPPLKYVKEKREEINNARFKKDELLDRLFERIRRHIKKYNLINDGQREIDEFLNTKWGE